MAAVVVRSPRQLKVRSGAVAGPRRPLAGTAKACGFPEATQTPPPRICGPLPHPSAAHVRACGHAFATHRSPTRASKFRLQKCSLGDTRVLQYGSLRCADAGRTTDVPPSERRGGVGEGRYAGLPSIAAVAPLPNADGRAKIDDHDLGRARRRRRLPVHCSYDGSHRVQFASVATLGATRISRQPHVTTNLTFPLVARNSGWDMCIGR